MNAASIKVGVWFLAVFGTVMLLQSKAVGDALLLFCAIGLVPGTDITLSPNGTLAVIAIVCLLTVAFAFRRQLVRWFMPRRGAPQLTILEDDSPIVQQLHRAVKAPVVATPNAIVAKVGAFVTSARLWTGTRPVVIITLPGKLGLFPRLARMLIARVPGWAQQARWLLRIASRKSSVWAKHAVARLRYMSVQYAGVAWQQAKVFWRQIEPYLRRFDDWLNVRLHSNKHTAAILAAGSKWLRVAQEWQARARTFVQSTRQK